MAKQLLNTDLDMLERMEMDLREKSAEALTRHGILYYVYGIFSLDQLESKSEAELARRIAIGIQYAGCKPNEIDFTPGSSAAPGQGTAARMTLYTFMLLLAVPTENADEERYNAGKLLTALRMGIHGSEIAGDRVARRWSFVQEAPNLAQSTDTLLFYSQLWQVSLPLVGPTQFT